MVYVPVACTCTCADACIPTGYVRYLRYAPVAGVGTECLGIHHNYLFPHRLCVFGIVLYLPQSRSPLTLSPSAWAIMQSRGATHEFSSPHRTIPDYEICAIPSFLLVA